MSFLFARHRLHVAFVANECSDITNGGFRDREVLLSVVALWEAEDGSSRFLLYLSFLFGCYFFESTP